MKSSRALTLLAGLAAVCASGQAQTPVFSTGQAARLVIGQQRFTTADYGTTNTLLGSVSGIAYANGVLWVADANRLGGSPNNNRVLRFGDAATYPGPTQDPTIPGSTCGVCRGNADLVLGQPDFISNNSGLTATGMRSPTGVATDGQILVIADTDNNRVLIWHSIPRANGQPADTVIGQPNFTSNATAVPPNAKSLRGPQGVWLAGGKLYVADTQDNRILIYNQIPAAGNNNVAADVVIGQPNFTTLIQPDLTQATATPAPNNMQTPVSVTTDGQRMYVADLAQNRILIWNTIPTTNGASADVAVGQPNLTSAISNNSFTITDSTLDADNNPKGVAPVMCQSDAAYAASLGQTGTSAVDTTTGTTIFPARCAATLSLPRYALSDGTRLFVADGGNDRVMVWNAIPAQSGQPADVVLGEPDQYSDNTGQNPDGSDAFQTPFSLAYDGLNLYVGDSYNRRVVVYTPGVPSIPLGAARNAASLNIYAIGSVTISGAIVAKDTVTITINGTGYTYTIVAADTLGSITDNLVNAINKAPGDPNVIATANDITDQVVLTAKVPNAPGGNITLATTVSTNAQVTATASGTTLKIYLQNPTQIAPGTLIEVFSQPDASLCDTVATGTAQPYLPGVLAGCELFIDGTRAPLLYVSPSQINAQMPYEFVERTSVSVYARMTHADGSITATTPIGVTIVPQNPGIFAQFGIDPRPGIVFHGSSNATAVMSVDGAINAGDQVALTIAGNTYNYTVLSTDTLATVRDALVSLVNNAPDPNVTAAAANQYQRLVLTAIQPGPAGEGIAVSQAVTGTNASLVLTVFNATTCCDNQQGSLVTPDNPAIPNEVVYVFATGLGDPTPLDLESGQASPAELNPPTTPVDSILTDGVAANILSATLVPGLVGVYSVQFQLGGGLSATDLQAQLTIAQQAFVSNVVTLPIVVPPTTSTASAIKLPLSRRR